MLERFTAPARQVVELAQQESDRLGHNYLGPEHVLAGIARLTEARAARMLRASGVDLEAMRAEIDRLVRHGFLPPPWRNDASLLSGLGGRPCRGAEQRGRNLRRPGGGRGDVRARLDERIAGLQDLRRRIEDFETIHAADLASNGFRAQDPLSRSARG